MVHSGYYPVYKVQFLILLHTIEPFVRCKDVKCMNQAQVLHGTCFSAYNKHIDCNNKLTSMLQYLQTTRILHCSQSFYRGMELDICEEMQGLGSILEISALQVGDVSKPEKSMGSGSSDTAEK